MPNIKSAKKELRKNVKRNIANSQIKADLTKLIKRNVKAITANDAKIKESFRLTVKALDKAVKKGLLKKNTANRKKSRLQKKINKIK